MPDHDPPDRSERDVCPNLVKNTNAKPDRICPPDESEKLLALADVQRKVNDASQDKKAKDQAAILSQAAFFRVMPLLFRHAAGYRCRVCIHLKRTNGSLQI